MNLQTWLFDLRSKREFTNTCEERSDHKVRPLDIFLLQVASKVKIIWNKRLTFKLSSLLLVGVLSPRTSLTVKIVVAQNTDIGNTKDSDIR